MMMKRFSLVASAPLKSPHSLPPRARHVSQLIQARRVSRIESRQFSRSTRSLDFQKYTLPRNFNPGRVLDLPAKMSPVQEAPRKRTAYIALGSNMGDRIGWIEKACNEMDARGIRVKRTSSLWETEPMYVLDQDRFVNGACEVETTLEPLELLDALQDIEKSLGRKKLIDKGPRNIDLDILLYDNIQFDHERLKIPHVGIAEREFVLRPLAEYNVDVLRHLDELRSWPGLQGLPWLVGSSRKSFIGRVTGVPTPKERIWGTAATVAAAVQGGADVVRVHDVREMAQVVAMADAIWRY
ncbi:HPPK-domain-containing protein [Thermothelomyces heterothallicus CBS 203.75]